MKSITLMIVAFISLQLFGRAPSLRLSTEIYQNSELDFISHREGGRFGSYLTMNINYSPMSSLLNQFESSEEVDLRSRGEAHITVVTPVEFYEVLSEFVSIEEINQLALGQGIQSTSFDVVCLGRGDSSINGKTESTYFVVVESSQMISLRVEIYNLFVARGGDSATFKPQHYFPHITLGFTKRDLHESDGVVKNDKSCIHEIAI